MKRNLINEVRQLQKIAGLLKEDEFAGFKPEYKRHLKVDLEEPEYFIKGIFDEAAIYNNEEIALIHTFGMGGEKSGITDYNTALTTVEKAVGYDESGNFDIEYMQSIADDMVAIIFPEQGVGELAGDHMNKLTDGKKCKLLVMLDDQSFEIWQ